MRLTETRLPFNLRAEDLGEAVVSQDARCALVSFIRSPLARGRDNRYVVFVTDGALATEVKAFEWSFTEGEQPPVVIRTTEAETAYRPKADGPLRVVVKLSRGEGEPAAQLSMNQEIVPPSAQLESLIEAATNETGPGVGNPDIARELVNDYAHYYHGVNTVAQEEGDAFRRFIFSLVHDGAQQWTPARRQTHLERLATAINADSPEFATLAARGAGICGLRLALLAMVVPASAGNEPPLLEWTELPEAAPRRAVADEQLRRRVAALDAPIRADLFNIARFPKSNIVHCGRVIEALRDRYFEGAPFEDVLTGLRGTRAHWILRHYREGPLTRV